MFASYGYFLLAVGGWCACDVGFELMANGRHFCTTAPRFYRDAALAYGAKALNRKPIEMR